MNRLVLFGLFAVALSQFSLPAMFSVDTEATIPPQMMTILSTESADSASRVTFRSVVIGSQSLEEYRLPSTVMSFYGPIDSSGHPLSVLQFHLQLSDRLHFNPVWISRRLCFLPQVSRPALSSYNPHLLAYHILTPPKPLALDPHRQFDFGRQARRHFLHPRDSRGRRLQRHPLRRLRRLARRARRRPDSASAVHDLH